MNRFIFPLAVVLALAPSSSQAYPAQNPYLPNLQNPPAITGTVVATTDHSMTVTTDEGEKIAFDVDSRSVMPARLSEGQRVRVEFHLMESGRYLTKRVTPMDYNEEMPATTSHHETEQTSDRSEHTAAMTSEHHGESVEATHTTQSTEASGAETERATAADADANVLRDRDAEPLPATSSSRPLIEGLGALALLAGTGLWIVRRRRRVA